MNNFFLSLIFSITLSACSNLTFVNFTTYFNTFYNAERLIKEAETEFEFQSEKIKAKPRLLIPDKELQVFGNTQSGPPPFMSEFIISERQRQPVKSKLDSIIIKGSKILSYKSKSKYVEGSIYLMAKSYFYKNEWLPSQIKCGELVDKFPDGDFSPDAHLLFAKNLLIQRKFHSGKIILSRTIDIAWQKQRFDILSEAFRLQADLALFEGDIEGAIRPYKQAIIQTEDNSLRAKWQFDLSTIYFRLGNFDLAIENFRKVRNYNPDYLLLFESYFYEAISLINLGDFSAGENILTKLKNDGKFQEWGDFTHSGFMLSSFLKNDTNEFKKLEIIADTAFRSSPPIIMVFYIKASRDYSSGNYSEARKYFARARVVRTPVYASSDKMYNILNNWEQKFKFAEPILNRVMKGEEVSDTSRMFLANNLFQIGRIFEQLGFNDSTEYYYKLAYEVSPKNDTTTARFLYAYSRSVTSNRAQLSDSLKELIIELYPNTEYGHEVLKEFGYTSYYLIDSARELLISGQKLIKNKEYSFGLQSLKTLYSKFPNSPYAPRCLYLIGIIYERDLRIPDSSLYYYQKLIDEFPESEYAKDVRLAVSYYLALQSGGPIPDSLKERTLPPPRQPALKGFEIAPKPVLPNSTIENDKEGGTDINPLDYFNDPSKIIKDFKNVLNPSNLKPSIDLPKKPLNEFQQESDSSRILNSPNEKINDNKKK
ncbi:MAG: tetratricopeptide repeat protein [Candidatus Kapaibacteriales bacterium]